MGVSLYLEREPNLFSMKVETVVEIDKPPSDVYDFIMDEENLILWIKNFVRIERINGEPGQVGSISKYTYDENGRTVEFIEEILVNEKDRLLKGVMRNRFMELTISNSLQPVANNSTKLTVVSAFHTKNYLYKLLLWVSKSKIASRQAEDIYRLKKAVEKLSEIE